MVYWFPERSPQGSWDGFFCTVPRPHFPGRVLIWPGCFGEHIVGLFGLYPSSLLESVGFVSLSEKASLVSISAAILFLRSWLVYFPLEFEFRGKRCVEWEHVGENGISCFLPCILLLYIEWIWTNYCKLSRNFVGAIRTTTINCRVSFSDLYLVFPRNFGMVFLPHSNTVILLELYCGTITEPGWPVRCMPLPLSITRFYILFEQAIISSRASLSALAKFIYFAL